MITSLTEEQLSLRDSLDRFFGRAYGFEQRRGYLGGALDGEGVWRALADDLGILGVPFSEALGGLGGTAADTMIIMEAFGRHLVLEPFLPTVILAGGVLRRTKSPLAHTLIPGIIAGDLRMAFAYSEPQSRYDWKNVATTARKTLEGYVLDGEKSVVLGGPQADKIIVVARTAGELRDRAGLSLFVVDAQAPGLEGRNYRLIDGRPASEMTFNEVEVAAEALVSDEGDAADIIEAVLDDGTAAVCAEASALLLRMVSDTVDYTKTRTQFGVPISSFQALQHRMVDMLISAQSAAAISTAAVVKLADDPVERGKAVSAAKAHVGRAGEFVARNAVQLHGGMGITDELPISHGFKRITVFETEFGSSDHHAARFEQTLA